MQNVKVDRDKYIGGSDIPIIMNISPFTTRWELLQQKAGLIENTFSGNQYTEYGNILEPKIRDFINQDLKDKFVEGKDIVDDIRCHTDGINKIMVLEIKTTSQIHKTLEEYKVYLVQLLFYMKYTKRKKGKLAVYERPEDFNEDFDESRLTIFDIDIKDYKELLEEIDLAVDDFRNDLKRLKENPFMTEADLEPKELIELVRKLEDVKKELTSYDSLVAKEKELKDQIKAKMDELGKKAVITDIAKCTRVADSKDTIIETLNEDKLKEDNLELYEKYAEEEIVINFNLDKFKEENEEESKKYITTSIKKGKAGYVSITLIDSSESNE